MKRYALPLIIIIVTAGLLGLIALGSKKAPDYSGGTVTEDPLSAEWVKGNQQSGIVLMEYSDFQCPACKAYQPLVDQIISQYGDRIAFVYRNFPLTSIHIHADETARVAEAAGLQGKFWEMHDLLFETQGQWENMVNATPIFEDFARQLGLDLERFKVDVSSDAVAQTVANDYARGLRIGVRGTPSFYLNGTPIELRSAEEFGAALDAATAVK